MLARSQSLADALRPHRFAIFAIAILGMLASFAVVFLVPSTLGFVLAGPLAIFPWCLGCLSVSRIPLFSFLFLAMAVLALGWAPLVLFT